MTKVKKYNLWPVCIGLVFFCNPYIAAVDILPDTIGCLLIVLALNPLARLHAPMREAQRAFGYLALIDLVKTLLLIFVFGNSVMGEQEVLILIVAFLGATLGTVFAVVAMRTLFNGIESLAMSYQCEALYAIKRNGKSRTELLSRFAVFFITFKEACLLLPEFAALLNSTYVDSPFVRLYDYIGVMRLLAVIPVIILGFIFFFYQLLYFVRAHRERDMWEKIGEGYAAYMDAHPSIRIRTRYRVAFLLLCVGLFFLTDFYMDYHNLISDTLGGCFILAAVLILRLPQRLLAATASLAVLYTVLATISTHKSYLFVSEHVGADINRSDVVAAEYQVMWLFSLAEFLCFLLLLLCLLLSLRAVLIKWGAYRPEYADADFEDRHYRKMREEFDWSFIKCYILGFLSAMLSFLYDYFQTWPNKKIFRLMEALWIPDFLLALLFAAYASYILTQVMQKIKERFMYE